MYDIEGVFPTEAISELEPGTNLLIAGPSMIGKRELTLELLTAGNESGDGVLFIMTSESAAVVIADLNQPDMALDWERIGVIDCVGTENQQVIDGVMTQSLSSPGDLTGIGAGTAKLLRHFSNQEITTVRHGLISISTLLQYLDLDTVFKFLYVYTRRIADTQGLGIFTVDHTGCEPRMIATIVSEFDGVIELRENDADTPKIRVRGLPDVSGDWQPFEKGI
jgi:KaiC/GvpD/RAD55 family RecA-like ATPase